jgi:TonB family protein
MSSKNNGFTASDIERYHSGEMLPEERHALEKAALDDPFLADALEGYAFTSTPSDDLAKIQLRLDEKKDRKKIVPLFQKYRWLSVAAILLVIVGTAWLAYNISGKESKTLPTALQKKKVDKDTNSVAVTPQNILQDSTDDKTTSVVQGSVSNNHSKVSTDKNKLTRETVGLTSNKQLNNSETIEINQNTDAEIVSRASSVPARNETAASNNNFANIQRINGNANKAISPDPRFNKVSNDITNKKLYYKAENNNNAGLAGKVNDIKTNDTIKELNIVLQALPQDSLKEIVVGYGIQKKSTEKYPHVIIDTLEPAEGYVSFDDYVFNNLKMPEELKTKTVSGEVQLSFDVDKEGQPTNISVVKSLCQKCDEEAIRLLKEGPKWKKGKNKKGKITIKF